MTPLFVIALPDSQPIAAAARIISAPASQNLIIRPLTVIPPPQPSFRRPNRHSGPLPSFRRKPESTSPSSRKSVPIPRSWPHRRRPYPKLNAPTPTTIISMDMPFIAKARGVSDSSSSCQRTRDSSVDITNTNSGRVANAAATSDAGPRL